MVYCTTQLLLFSLTRVLAFLEMLICIQLAFSKIAESFRRYTSPPVESYKSTRAKTSTNLYLAIYVLETALTSAPYVQASLFISSVTEIYSLTSRLQTFLRKLFGLRFLSRTTDNILSHFELY